MYYTIISTKTFLSFFWPKKDHVFLLKAVKPRPWRVLASQPPKRPKFFIQHVCQQTCAHVHPFLPCASQEFFQAAKFSLWWLPEVNNMCRLRARETAGQALHGMMWLCDSGFRIHVLRFHVAFWWNIFWSWRMLGWYCRVTCTIPHVYVILLFLFIYIFSDIPNAVPGNYVFVHVLSHCVTVGCWSHI